MEPNAPEGVLPPPPDVPGRVTPEMLGSSFAGPSDLPAGVTSAPPPQAVAAALAMTDSEPQAPEIGKLENTSVELPAGYIDGDMLLTTATVRELVGFDEEKLSRINAADNYAKYLTKMLELGVEEIGGVSPNVEMLRTLLIGDRDALVFGIRRATYGREFEFELTCPKCEHLSKVVIDLVNDVPVTKLDDPMKREFEVPDTRHHIRVKLIDGYAQEAFSAHIEKKTAAELTTLTLAQSVIAIDGRPVKGRELDVQSLPSHDRDKILEFLREHQPGPKYDNIPVNCATCETEYPYRLGLGDLFRF